MKFSESWLRELINIPVGTDDLVEQLTMAGLEVESVTDWQGKFSGVIVARVLSREALPDTDKLSLCKVDAGPDGQNMVVCGADNIQTGRCYAYAKPGAVLARDMRIDSKKVMGVMSEGMLCSEKELGLADTASGIFQLGDDAKPGDDLGTYLGIDDRSIELSLTPNRGDCLSLAGIAREVAVLNQMRFSAPKITHVPVTTDSMRGLCIDAAEACPLYCGRIIENVNAAASTPVWIVERLRRSGLRSISVIVDLTNYVMLELGQPMHAFDNSILRGDIRIRMAASDETLVLLDGNRHKLTDNTLVISDDSGAIAMAGIMGGEPTSVTTKSHALFLESAFFSPRAIMGRARQYGLHTDASHRFERGVDPEMARLALERLSGLILTICGGEAGPVVEAREASYLPDTTTVSLRSMRIKRVLGEDIDDARVSEILQQLGFGLSFEAGQWQVSVPSFRFDIGIEADLIEEVARIYGYRGIKEQLPLREMEMGLINDRYEHQQSMAQGLVAKGYREVVTYSFVDPALQSLMFPGDEVVTLMNPLSSEMSVMRQSLWPGLLTALQYNIKRQQSRLRLFETGHVFAAAGDAVEHSHMSGLSYGNIYPEQWDIINRQSDFYDLKGDIESILSGYLEPLELDYQPARHPALHAGQCAEIRFQGRKIGLIGTLNPRIQGELGLARPVGLFELDLEEISQKKSVKYQNFSKFPSIRRDIAIIVDEKIPAVEVINHVKSVGSELLSNLELFDVYHGEGIDLGKKSLALGLTFQRSSSTLTDEEADIVVGNIIHSLYEQLGASLRE